MAGKVIPDELVGRMMQEGKKDREILAYLKEHEHIVVTRQGLSAWRVRRGKTMKASSEQAVPWKLRPEHVNTEPARTIRLYKRRENGLPLGPVDEKRLKRVEDHLAERDGVFHYIPERGFVIVKRRPGIDTGIVRAPDA